MDRAISLFQPVQRQTRSVLEGCRMLAEEAEDLNDEDVQEGGSAAGRMVDRLLLRLTFNDFYV